MFKLIKNIISYIQNLSEKNNTVSKTLEDKKETIDTSNYFTELAFHLSRANDIDISYILPSTKDCTPDQIMGLAEKYAKFLLIINEGYLKEDIIHIIDEHVNKSENPNDHLFWENVIVHWGLLHVESLKNKKINEKKDQPLIRPLYAFASTDN